MAHCFVTRELPGPAVGRLRSAGHTVEVWPQAMPPDRDALLGGVAQADGLLSLLTDDIDADLIDAAPRLIAIANYAVGYDNIDLRAAARRQIAVGNTPDVLTDATADLAFALLMTAARRLPEAVHDARNGEWSTWEPGRWLGHDVFGATLGIVGMGRIGCAVARRAAGFDMTVLHTARSGGVTLEELLERSDFVSLHCPLTDETRHLIDADALAQMKDSAVLINTARGPIVDQPALLAALHAGHIAGAALDVTDPEPPPPGDPVYTTPNLIVAPHIGSATRTAREQMADLAVENLLAALSGEPMPHPVALPGD